MFSSLSFVNVLFDEKISSDVKSFDNIKFEPIVLQSNNLHICDTIETVKSVLSQCMRVPNEYISLWFIENPNTHPRDIHPKMINGTFIGLQHSELHYSLHEAILKTPPTNNNSNNPSNNQRNEENLLHQNYMFDISTPLSAFVQPFDFDFSRVIVYVLIIDKSFVVNSLNSSHQNILKKYWGRATPRCICQPFSSDISRYFQIKNSIFTTINSLYNNDEHNNDEHNNDKHNNDEHNNQIHIRERLMLIEYRAKKRQVCLKRINRYGESVYNQIILSRDVPFASLNVPSLDKHQFNLYVGKDSALGVETVEQFIYQTQNTPGLSLRMLSNLNNNNSTIPSINPTNHQHTNPNQPTTINTNINRRTNYQKKIPYATVDFQPTQIDVLCTDKKYLLDTTVHKKPYLNTDIYQQLTTHTFRETESIYSKFLNTIHNVKHDFIAQPSIEITKISLAWKLYLPISRIEDIIDKKIIGYMFRKVKNTQTDLSEYEDVSYFNSTHSNTPHSNTTHCNTTPSASHNNASKYISQHYLKYEYDPCIWNKYGNQISQNHLNQSNPTNPTNPTNPSNPNQISTSNRIVCLIRTTSSNSIMITIQSTCFKNRIDLMLLMWVYEIWRYSILGFVLEKTKTPKTTGQLRLKDIDPYLFADSVRKGGYSRKCSDFKDDQLQGRIRYKQPTIINMDNEEDMKLYNSLKYPSYIVKYRNNCYVGMLDELRNADVIEEHNRKAQETKSEKFEYYNTVILFEIHEEKYRAPNSDPGLLYPSCVKRKSRLSKRHLDLMRQAYLDGEIEILGHGKDELIKQFETHNYIINNEVGYIMQASRTLPVGTHGHLPSDNTGVFEWFRQNCYLSKNKNKNEKQKSETKMEFLRKGIIHDDPFNFVHAIFDALNFKNYQSLLINQRKDIVKQYCRRWGELCTFGLFRTLQDGTLAQRFSYNDFISALLFHSDSSINHLYHTEFSDLFGYFLNVNIIVFDCDVMIHNISEKSAKLFFTTLQYDKSIFLLKIRGIYEPIILHKEQENNPMSIFTKDSTIIRGLVDILNNNHLIHFIDEIKTKYGIVGQILSANNQCTHIITKHTHIPIPIKGLCVPFKNIPILPYYHCGLIETLNFFKQLHIFPKYLITMSLNEKRYVYAIQLTNDIFCQVNQFELNQFELNQFETNQTNQFETNQFETNQFETNQFKNNGFFIFNNEKIAIKNNIDLKEPFYPEIKNAIICQIQNNDNRISFMKNLNYIRETFDFLCKTWHLNEFKPNEFKPNEFNSLKTSERRLQLHTLVSEKWVMTFNNDTTPAKYKYIMQTYERQLKFVLLNFLFRNPDFFTLPFVSKYNVQLNQNNQNIQNNENTQEFENSAALKLYLNECKKAQISRLYITVKKQERILYNNTNDEFIVFDKSFSDFIEHKNIKRGNILDIVFAAMNQQLNVNQHTMYQEKIVQWLKQFPPDMQVIGTWKTPLTFSDLIDRDDMSDVLTALCIIIDKCIEVININKKTINIYGTSLTNNTLSNNTLFNNTLSNNTLSNNTLSNNTLSNNTLSNNTLSNTIQIYYFGNKEFGLNKIL